MPPCAKPVGPVAGSGYLAGCILTIPQSTGLSGRKSPTMTLRESYRVLDLPPGASLKTIKRAYRRHASTWHPDRYPEDPERQARAEERIKTINAAYTRLCAASERERAALRRQSPSRPASRPSATQSEATKARGRSRPPERRRKGRSAVPRDRRRKGAERRTRRRKAASTARDPDSLRTEGYHRTPPRSSPARTGSQKGRAVETRFQAWGRVVLVAGAVGAFCLGLLRSTSLAEMLAWTAMWAVIAAGAFALTLKTDA